MPDRTELLKRIVIDPKILVGKPIIRGTRLAVEHVLDLMAEGLTHDEILKEHDQLTKDDLTACLLFARETLADITYSPQPCYHCA